MSVWYERFSDTIASQGDRPAVVTPSGTLTYRALHDRAEQWQRDHWGETGRVVVVHADTFETVVTLIGAWGAGRSMALLQASTPPAALQSLRDRLALPVPSAASGDPLDQETLVLSTSGTTGTPKLVALAHRAVGTMLDYLVDWYRRPPGTATLIAVPLVMATALPQLLVGLVCGWTVHIYPEGAPIPLLHEVLRRERIALLPGTASFYRVLLAYAPGAAFPDVTSMRIVGEAMEPQLLAQLTSAFPNASRFQTYGATDVWRVAVLPMEDPRLANGGVGIPLPHCEVWVRPLPGLPSGQGELLVRGLIVCLGYVGATGAYEGLEAGGWLTTRDVGEVDADGCLYLRGRVDALFKSGGHWVNPLEVERVLCGLPGVTDARCFPEPHHLLGQVPIAEVVPTAGHALDPAHLRRACQGSLASHQVPKAFRIVPDVARGESGKKQRR